MSLVQAELEAAIERDPGLLLLGVVKRAKRLLPGDPENAVLGLQQDLDKIRDRKLWKFVQESAECFKAASRIEEVNQQTNEGRGSSVARAICTHLRKIDLPSACRVYQADGDKVVQYPDLLLRIESSIIGCRAHSRPYWCSECRS